MHRDDDPTSAFLDRIEAELEAQNRELADHFLALKSAPETLAFPVADADLDALEEACTRAPAAPVAAVFHAIRC